MKDSTNEPLATLEADASLRRRRRFERWLVQAAIVAVALLGVVFYFRWRQERERRGLLELPPEQRLVLYQQTLSGFRTLCGGPVSDALVARCSEEAEFLRRFPECDADCHRLTQGFLSGPSR